MLIAAKLMRKTDGVILNTFSRVSFYAQVLDLMSYTSVAPSYPHSKNTFPYPSSGLLEARRVGRHYQVRL
jgi:hypothetical protein